MRRRTLLAAGAVATLGTPALAQRRGAPAAKTLRVAYGFTETGFDPPRVSDLVSGAVISHVFESPLAYDHLARPARLRPNTAAALPEVDDDHRRFVFTLRPGIRFADDPVFGGRPRELVAADYVYSIKRYVDPAIPSEHLHHFDNAKIVGLDALRRRAVERREPLDYDAEVPGLRVLDRYRFEVRLAEPAPRLAHLFAAPGLTGAVAREVVDAYAADPMAHPVGTGPFRLAQWRRSSLIVLERNRHFRDQVYDSEPPPGDAAAQAVARHLRGRRLPCVDRVEISIIEESQPRWLAFVGGDLDVLELPSEFAPVAVPGGVLAAHLARRGVVAQRALGAEVTHTFFNFDDPVVGGYTPPQVALRRAVALAYDNALEARLVRQGQALPAQSMLPPHTYGHDPALRSELGRGDAARAKALLDMHGFVDRDGDGWRERPDGSPLVLRRASTGDQRARAINELWRKQMSAVGLRMRFEVAPFGELIRRSLAGTLQTWSFTWSAFAPDADFFLGLAYGPNAGQSNDARFRLPAFDRLYERQRVLPDGPERLAAMHEATRLMLAYMPYIAHNHRINTDLLQPHVRGYLRHPFARDEWRYADRDATRA